MNTEIIAALIGAAVTVANVAFTSITTRKRRQDERTEQLEAGVQCLLRAEIIRSHESTPSAGSARYTPGRRSQGRTRHIMPSAGTTLRPTSITT